MSWSTWPTFALAALAPCRRGLAPSTELSSAHAARQRHASASMGKAPWWKEES
jgi:hypothetical protein